MKFPWTRIGAATLSVLTLAACSPAVWDESGVEETTSRHAELKQEVRMFAKTASGAVEMPIFDEASAMYVELSLRHSQPDSFPCTVTSGVGFDVAQLGVTVASFRDQNLVGTQVLAAAPKAVAAEWPISDTRLPLGRGGVYVLLPRNPLSCEGATPVTATGRTFAFYDASTSAVLQIELFSKVHTGELATAFPLGTTPEVTGHLYNTSSTDVTCSKSNSADIGGLYVYSDSDFLGQIYSIHAGLQIVSERKFPPGLTEFRLPPITLEHYNSGQTPPPLSAGRYFVEYRGLRCRDVTVKPGVTWFDIVP